MAVCIVEIGNDVPSGLVYVPIQPRCGRHGLAFRPTSFVGELVDSVHVNIAWLRSHGLEFSIVLDGEQTFGVPEAFVVGVKRGDGRSRGYDECTDKQLAALRNGEPCTPGFDEQSTTNEIDAYPHQHPRHNPRYRIEHLRNPWFPRPAQQITVRVELAEI